MVSIHAPREGCDLARSLMCWRATPFQFTHPGRGATGRSIIVQMGDGAFQFTHPGRGATRREQLLRTCLDVSIHAPREGCDSGALALLMLSIAFQFTHPGRGATVWCKVAYYGADKQA